jgi:hypothetical protein
MTPSGIEPATFRFVAQYLNHCATAFPMILYTDINFDCIFSVCEIIFRVELKALRLFTDIYPKSARRWPRNVAETCSSVGSNHETTVLCFVVCALIRNTFGLFHCSQPLDLSSANHFFKIILRK